MALFYDRDTIARAMYIPDANGNPIIPTAGSSAQPNIVQDQGAPTLNVGRVSVGTTATLIAAARATRRSITVTANAATALVIGGATVTTANGFPLQATAGASVTINTTAAVYGVVATGTLDVGYLETY